jgi:hypothetical protein
MDHIPQLVIEMTTWMFDGNSWINMDTMTPCPFLYIQVPIPSILKASREPWKYAFPCSSLDTRCNQLEIQTSRPPMVHPDDVDSTDLQHPMYLLARCLMEEELQNLDLVEKVMMMEEPQLAPQEEVPFSPFELFLPSTEDPKHPEKPLSPLTYDFESFLSSSLSSSSSSSSSLSFSPSPTNIHEEQEDDLLLFI